MLKIQSKKYNKKKKQKTEIRKQQKRGKVCNNFEKLFLFMLLK